MATPRLSPHAAKAVDARVDEVFDGLLTRLLAGAFSGKRLYITHDPDLSLPGIFAQAVTDEGGRPDIGVFHGIAEVIKDLLDRNRAQAKADTKRRIQSLLYDIQQGNLEPEHFGSAVQGELTELYGRVRNQVERVVESEAEHVTTIGIKEGIEQINDSLGVEDPTVVFIPVNDAALCDECRRLHLLSDGVTPRVWKESEVSHDYHKRGENFPSWHLLHPHCRCALATVLPGFGFDNDGRITWVGEGHDELAYQRGYKRPPKGYDARRKKLGKSEVEPATLKKMAHSGIKDGQVWDVPLSNVWVLPYYANPCDPRRVDAFVQNPNAYPDAKLPHALLGDEQDFKEHVKLTPHPVDPAHPKFFVQDGTHRSRAAAQRGDRSMKYTVDRCRWSKRYEAEIAQELQSPESREARRKFVETNPGLSPELKAMLLKSEPEVGEPLKKFDYKYPDVRSALEQHGWKVTSESGNHQKWDHPEIPAELKNQIQGPTAGGVKITRDFIGGSRKHDDRWLESHYLKSAGLMVSRQGADAGRIKPDPSHPFAAFYRSKGLLPALEGQPAEKRTWEPQSSTGWEHVPIEKVHATLPDGAWEHGPMAGRFENALRERGRGVPALNVMEDDGEFYIMDSHDAYAAALRAGMTHVPVIRRL